MTEKEDSTKRVQIDFDHWVFVLERLICDLQNAGGTRLQKSMVPDRTPSADTAAASHYRFRRKRDSLLSDQGWCNLLGEPVWDMLLDLFIAKANNRQVSVSSLCIAANVPATTALRHIVRMEEVGLIRRYADPHDKRRIFISLNDDASQLLTKMFSP